MKKVFAVILSGLMIASLAACGQSTESKASEASAQETTKAVETTVEATTATETLAGGYTDAESPVLTDEIKALFDKATEGLTGVSYVPVAYVASQVVAGTNHLILCKATTVTEEPKTTYALVTLYEDLNGGAEITDIQNSDTEAPSATEEPMDGAETEPETPEVTAEAKEALAKATETLAGASYEPVALLATQVVNGTNYGLLCKVTTVTAEPVSKYAIVAVYANSDGTAEITGVAEFTSGTQSAVEEDAIAAEQAESSEG